MVKPKQPVTIKQKNNFDVAIIGAGPAGLSAAIEAARHKLRVLVVDENSTPGGQLPKQIHKFFGSTRHGAGVRGFQIAEHLLKECKKHKVEIMRDTSCIGVFQDAGLKIALVSENSLKYAGCENLIIATGAKENTIAFPGWTLPNIMGAGAMQTLVNLHRVIPGKRVLMIGSGNVGLIVSYQLMQAGLEVVGVVEALNKCTGYYVHFAKLKRLGVPFYFSHTIKEASGKNSVEKVIIAKINERGKLIPNTEQKISADVVCLAVGLSPLADLSGIAGCKMHYNTMLKQMVPVRTDELETTVKNIYVAGDAGGVEEASIAMEEGRLAAVSIAAKLGKITKIRKNKLKKELMLSLKELRAYRKMFTDCKKTNVINLRRKKGPVAILECNEDIPCNPCKDICHKQAITLDGALTNIPSLDQNKCSGCGLCIPYCPGLAIIVVDDTFSENESLIKLPYEFLPLPQPGSKVEALDKNGKVVCQAKVIKVDTNINFNRTKIISIAVPKRCSDIVRGMRT